MAPGALSDERDVRAAYAAHAGELYGFALRSLGDGGLAEEAVQETFLRAWRAGERFDPELGSLRTWLFAILRNVVIDLGRSRAARPPLAREVAAELGIPEGTVKSRVYYGLRALRVVLEEMGYED
jgi:RNA polymerase sigma-70 factor (ECF subfamily)